MKKDIINISIVNKGRLKIESENIFKKAKLKILTKSDRSLIASIKGYPSIRIIYQNASEIIQALGTGTCEIGISGKDLWRESEASIQSKISLIKQYEWGKSDLVVAVSKSWLDCVNPTDLEEISKPIFLADCVNLVPTVTALLTTSPTPPLGTLPRAVFGSLLPLDARSAASHAVCA